MSEDNQFLTEDYIYDEESLGLLLEAVGKNELIKYIKEKRLINFRYDSPRDPNNEGYYRNIEPYVLGISKAGNLVLRAWQTNISSSASMDQPNWRMFRVDGMSQLIPVNMKFETDIQTLKTTRPGYNADDKDMTKIIISILPNDPRKNIGQKNKETIGKPKVSNTSNQKSFFKQQADDFKKKTQAKKQQKATPKIEPKKPDAKKSVFATQTDKMKIPVKKKPQLDRSWVKDEFKDWATKQKAKKRKK